MFKWLKRKITAKPATYLPVAQPNRVVLTATCRDALQEGLAPEIASQHEGIVYLLGQTDGFTSLAASVYRPNATTTAGSFLVEPKAMRRVVDAASANGLQVVGQLHTHPKQAFHSPGDETGTLIRFNGFISIVLPDYGAHLPSLEGAAIYMFRSDERRFIQLNMADLIVLPTCLP